MDRRGLTLSVWSSAWPIGHWCPPELLATRGASGSVCVLESGRRAELDQNRSTELRAGGHRWSPLVRRYGGKFLGLFPSLTNVVVSPVFPLGPRRPAVSCGQQGLPV